MNKLKTLTVIGSGLMGSGIAQVSASSGFNVHLIDKNSESLEKALFSIKKNLQRVAKKKFTETDQANDFINQSLLKIKTSTDPIDAIKDSDLVIEAIVENLGSKVDFFRSIDSIAPSPCIFASNTSSLSVKSISNSVQRKDRFIGLHFFNPVPVMKLLEVIKTSDTSESTLQTAIEFGKSINKKVVTCKDTPGFIVNRLLIPYMMEALRMYERGVSSLEEIDIAMKLGAGHPMGPFELADYVGLDTIKFIMDGWSSQYPEEVLFKSCDILNQLVSENKLGCKSGQGFYTYDSMGNRVE